MSWLHHDHQLFLYFDMAAPEERSHHIMCNIRKSGQYLITGIQEWRFKAPPLTDQIILTPAGGFPSH